MAQMKPIVLIAALLLAGCSTATDQAFTNSIVTLTKAGCHLTVNLAAQAGAVNPGSGVQFQGSADCPSTLGRAGVERPMVILPSAEQPAPSASFLK
jgi:hypothetical protein